MDAAQLLQLIQAAAAQPNQVENMQAVGGMFQGQLGVEEEEEDELSPQAREVHTSILEHIQAGQDDDDLVTALLSGVSKDERSALIHADWEQLLRDIAVHGNVRILEVLLAHGGDVDWEAGADDDSFADDPNGEHAQMNTIWNRACRNGQKAILLALQSHADMGALTCNAPSQGALEAGHRGHDGIVGILMDTRVEHRPIPLEIDYCGGPIIAAPASGGCLGDLRELMTWAAPTVTNPCRPQQRDHAMAGAVVSAIHGGREHILWELSFAEPPFTPLLNIATEHRGSCLSALAAYTQATDADTRIQACRMVLQLAQADVPAGAEFEWSATRNTLEAGLMGAPLDAAAHLEFMDNGPGHQTMRIGRHETDLTRAASSGDVEAAVAALGRADIVCQDEELAAALSGMHRQEAFLAAAKGGHTHVCAALLAAPAFQEHGGLLDETADTALVLACAGGAGGMATWLLEHTPADATAYGQLAFRLACRRGHVDCVQALLKAEGSPVDPSEGGEEAFIGACRGGHVGIAKLLVAQAASAQRTLDAGAKRNSALLWAASGGHGACVEWLLQLPPSHGVDMAQDDGAVLLAAVSAGDKRATQQLLQASAEWQPALLQQSALAAAKAGAHGCLKELLESPASAELDLGADQQALFTAACGSGSVEAVAMLAEMTARGVRPWYQPTPPPPMMMGGRTVMMHPRNATPSGLNIPSFNAACSQAQWPVVRLMLSWQDLALACPARPDAMALLHSALVPDSILVHSHKQRWLHFALQVLSLGGEELVPVSAVADMLHRCLHWINVGSNLDTAACAGIAAAIAALAPQVGPRILQRMLPPGSFDVVAFSAAATARTAAMGGASAAVLSFLSTKHGTPPVPVHRGFTSHEYQPLLLLVRHVALAEKSGLWLCLPLLLGAALQEWGLAHATADIAAAKHRTDEKLRHYKTGNVELFSEVWQAFCQAVRARRWWYLRHPILRRRAAPADASKVKSESKRR